MRSALALAICAVGSPTAIAHKLPHGFVILSDVDDTIAQDIRYAGSHNFMGRSSPGYEGAACILTNETAQALSLAQRQLSKEGLSLTVYDCYRPARAVRDFKKWSQAQGDEVMKAEFYPETRKRDLFALGYIASHSVHSRGCAIDLSIGPAKARPSSSLPKLPAGACTAKLGDRYDDGTLDMGTSYDCFSDLSRTYNSKVSDEARRNRSLLVSVMTAAGFKNYGREWWHFELNDACAEAERDFPIPPLSTQQTLAREPATSACALADVLPTCIPPARVHEEPGADSPVIASITKDAGGIECLRCEAASSAVPASKENWCLIEFYQSGASRAQGWVQRRAEAVGDVRCEP